jgi:hypothetical protein
MGFRVKIDLNIETIIARFLKSPNTNPYPSFFIHNGIALDIMKTFMGML